MTDYCPEKSLPQVGLVQSGLTVDSALCKDLLAAFTGCFYWLLLASFSGQGTGEPQIQCSKHLVKQT